MCCHEEEAGKSPFFALSAKVRNMELIPPCDEGGDVKVAMICGILYPNQKGIYRRSEIPRLTASAIATGGNACRQRESLRRPASVRIALQASRSKKQATRGAAVILIITASVKAMRGGK